MQHAPTKQGKRVIFQPIKSENKTNPDPNLLAGVFPRLVLVASLPAFGVGYTFPALGTGCTFSRAWHRLHVFASSTDWFTALAAVIGQM